MARKSQKNVGKTTKKITRNFDAKHCAVCANVFIPKCGVQKYCDNCRTNILKQQKVNYTRKYNQRAKMKVMEAEKKARYNSKAEIEALKASRIVIKHDIEVLKRNLLIVAIISTVAFLASIVAIVL